jgi:hypothetical protein
MLLMQNLLFTWPPCEDDRRHAYGSGEADEQMAKSFLPNISRMTMQGTASAWRKCYCGKEVHCKPCRSGWLFRSRSPKVECSHPKSLKADADLNSDCCCSEIELHVVHHYARKAHAIQATLPCQECFSEIQFMMDPDGSDRLIVPGLTACTEVWEQVPAMPGQ